jgi:hypothetical protein
MRLFPSGVNAFCHRKFNFSSTSFFLKPRYLPNVNEECAVEKTYSLGSVSYTKGMGAAIVEHPAEIALHPSFHQFPTSL